MKFAYFHTTIIHPISSLPSRECGLKLLFLDRVLNFLLVTPFAGVWIEMIVPVSSLKTSICHSLRGSVDWNNTYHVINQFNYVTPFAGVWIEILWIEEAYEIMDEGHSLRGSVDWNFKIANDCFYTYQVTPFAGVWIEMVFRGEISPSKIMSLSLRECILKSKSLSLGEILD